MGISHCQIGKQHMIIQPVSVCLKEEATCLHYKGEIFYTELIAAYSEKYVKPINTLSNKSRVITCWRKSYIHLPVCPAT
jgi:ferric iron reductase protein FhuF